MAKINKKPADTRSPFTGKNGYDVMAGPQIRTTPTCEPKFLPKVPQLGLNMGMDIRRP